MTPSATSATTTAPAPTTAFAPIATPGSTRAPIPNAKLSADQTQDVKRRILQAATQYRRSDRITFPIAVRMVAARKPL